MDDNSDLDCAWNKSEWGFDVNMIFRLASQLLCIWAVIGNTSICTNQLQWASSWSATTLAVTVDIHICSLLSMIIRCVQKIKQAHVQYMCLYLQSSVYMLNAVLAALHFLNIRKKFFFFPWTWESLLSFGRFCFFVSKGSVKCCTTKDTLWFSSAATETHHMLDTDAITKWHLAIVPSAGRSLWSLNERSKSNL